MKHIYYNGSVYTGSLPLVQAFAEEDGRFVFAGSNEEAAALASCNDVFVDLGGRFVCADFNDSHMHLLNFGTSLVSAKLGEHTDSLAGMIEYLKAFFKERQWPEGSWLTGRGWNQDYFTDVHRMPSRYDLDQVSTEVPILITRACGHCLVLNSKALEIAGLTLDTPIPEGGNIGRENGVLDGRLFDNAMGFAYSKVPVPGKEEVKERIINACRALNSYGVTSSQTDDFGVTRGNWQVVCEAYKELEAEGKLTVRVYEQSNFTTPEALQGYLDAGCITGRGSDLFKVGPLKMLGDGALGARTAFLSIPYADDPSTKGLPVFTQEQLNVMIDLAVKNGMQAAVHAIGDACLDYVLNAYEAAFEKYHPVDHRCGIVHCQISRPDQLQRIADLKLHVYAQSIFLDYDINIVEARVGEKLASSSYSWKTLMNKGVTVSNGTDCPVELPDALKGIQCAVTRCSTRGAGPYLESEAFTVQEALDSYTSAGAYSSFDEKVKGKIQPGMLADFVILAEDPFKAPADHIKDIKVCETYLGGKKVF